MDVVTKLTENSPKVKTDLTLDWTGVSNAEVKEYATRTAVINAQRFWRAAGKIPTGKVTVKVRDLLDGKRPARVVSPDTILADFGKMSPEEKKKALADLMAAANAPEQK